MHVQSQIYKEKNTKKKTTFTYLPDVARELQVQICLFSL